MYQVITTSKGGGGKGGGQRMTILLYAPKSIIRMYMEKPAASCFCKGRWSTLGPLRWSVVEGGGVLQKTGKSKPGV